MYGAECVLHIKHSLASQTREKRPFKGIDDIKFSYQKYYHIHRDPRFSENEMGLFVKILTGPWKHVCSYHACIIQALSLKIYHDVFMEDVGSG